MTAPPHAFPGAAASRGRFVNSGNGPTLVPVDIGHDAFIGLVDPDSAFWSLVRKERLHDVLAGGELLAAYREKAADFAEEMRVLRFGLKPSAVYFNPTERCNLDCAYCYIPAAMRRNGAHMPADELLRSLARLKDYFGGVMSGARRPRVIFHGAEPMLNREAMFAGIDAFGEDFGFGVQTNATLLDDAAIEFLTSRGVSIGLSLDGPEAETDGLTRVTWGGRGVYGEVLRVLEKLRGYDAYNVIATITATNLHDLTRMVELFHGYGVPSCLLNVVRCTLPGGRGVKAGDAEAAERFIAALDRSHALYRETGRKLVVANFANVLLAILAPTARRLMCDISPCGGGRAFFAVAANGDLFPCSEFIGLETFRGGNLFEDEIGEVLAGPAFRKVTERNVDDFEPCRRCAIRHYCGAPCPAEAHEMRGSMDHTGACCEFYETQVRYAFRLIADGVADAFLWDDWDEGLDSVLDFTAP